MIRRPAGRVRASSVPAGRTTDRPAALPAARCSALVRLKPDTTYWWPGQNTNFNANCNCRIGTVPLIELIVPNAPLPGVGMELFPAAAQLLWARLVLGSAQFGVFNKL